MLVTKSQAVLLHRKPKDKKLQLQNHEMRTGEVT